MEKSTHSRKYRQNRQSLGISIILDRLHWLVQLLLPMVKLNRVSQPISIEYKMVHGLRSIVKG